VLDLRVEATELTIATFTAAQVLRVVPRVRLSQAVGRLCDARVPAPLSRLAASIYSRAYGVNLDEAASRDAPYGSFDEFFTRRLRGGVRPIAESSVVSPADGRLEQLGPVTAGGEIIVKNTSYRVGELIGDEQEARRYEGGSFAVVYLSPGDYHRVHSPVAGRLVLVRSLPGDLFPVNSIGERHIPNLFVRNQRVALVIDTAHIGRVTVVMVGAIIVGRITVTALGGADTRPGVYPIEPAAAVDIGDEVGVFHLGSTAVLFVEPGTPLGRDLGPIRYGQALSSR
jgi:phosphatidylserine decarboxylase